MSVQKHKEKDLGLPISELYVEKLIFFVQERPALYNFNLKDYHNKDIADKLWEEVGKYMKASTADCRLKWASLRNAYARHMRQEKTYVSSGSKGTKKKQWYLAEVPSFLTEFVGQHRTMSSNLRSNVRQAGANTNTEDYDSFMETYEEEKEEQHDDSSGFVELTIAGNLTRPTSPIQPPTRPPGFGKRTFRPQKPWEMVASTMIDFFKSRSQLPPKHDEDGDGDLYYLKGLLPDLKKLDERRKRKFKQDIIRQLNDILDEQDEQRSSPMMVSTSHSNTSSPHSFTQISSPASFYDTNIPLLILEPTEGADLVYGNEVTI